MIAEVKFNVIINDDFFEEFKKIIDHHIEYLIDFDGNPEIQGIYGATVTKVKDD